MVKKVVMVMQKKDTVVVVNEMVMDSPQFKIGFMTTLFLTT